MVLSHQTGVRIPVALPSLPILSLALLLAAAPALAAAPSAPAPVPPVPGPRATATPAAGATIVGAAETALKSGTGRFEISAWDRLLKEGTREGLVDYDFMRNNRA